MLLLFEFNMERSSCKIWGISCVTVQNVGPDTEICEIQNNWTVFLEIAGEGLITTAALCAAGWW